MNRNNPLVEQIAKIGDDSFAKLKTLNIPPYPKYYHDTFMDELIASDNPSLIGLSKKYTYLFGSDENNTLSEVTFDLAKATLDEFQKSNNSLKDLSDKNVIDISTIRKEYKRIQPQEIISVFDSFQAKVLSELKNADETVLKLKLEIEKLERESHIDPLTKAYNRMVLTKDLQEILVAVTDKENTDLQIILFDADDFKNINDSYGHIAGDKTLIFIVKLIQSLLRKGTKIYRYGGEEFIVVLNRTSMDDAKKTAQRIISEADESKLLYKGHNIHLTLSAGIASFTKGNNIEDLIEKTDKALYKAKENGKNRFEVSQ